jgi:hypothetical protein
MFWNISAKFAKMEIHHHSSYVMRLFDVITEFDRVMFLGRLSESESKSLLCDGDVEYYTDDEGDEVRQVSQDVLLNRPLKSIPVVEPRQPYRP